VSGMAEGFQVITEQIRTHARNVEAVEARFQAVKSASAHITQNDKAYGLLCAWMPMILEGRHKRQDELYSYVEENLSLVSQHLVKAADGYDDADNAADERVRGAGRLGR